MSSRQLEEQQERDANQRIAEYIGLTYEEYADLGANIEANESDDGLTYSYMVIFDLPLPPHIASKIRELDGDRVHLPAGLFEEEEGPLDD